MADFRRRTTRRRATPFSAACARRWAARRSDAQARAATRRPTSPRMRTARGPSMPADLVQRFVERATDMASTVERIAAPEAIPAAVARYLDALELPPRARRAEVARRRLLARIRRPRLGAARASRSRRGPRPGDDRLGITGCLLRDRRDRHAGVRHRRRVADRDARCCPTRTSPCVRADRIVSRDGGSVRARPRASCGRCRARST